MKEKFSSKVTGILLFIDRFHWLWLALASPLLLFPSPKRSPVLLVVPSLWLVDYLTNRYSPSKTKTAYFPITPLNVSLLMMILMVLVSLWATYDIAFSLEKISGTVLGLGVFFAVKRLGKDVFGWLLSLAAILTGGFAWAGISFLAMDYQIRFSPLAPIIRRVPKVFNTLPGTENGLHHNAVGGTLLWVLPSCLVISVYMVKEINKEHHLKNLIHSLLDKGHKEKEINASGGQREARFFQKALKRFFLKLGTLSDPWFLSFQILFWTGSLFSCVVFLLSQSRGSFLALGLALISILLIVLPSKWRRVLYVTLLLIIGIFVIFLLAIGGWENYISQSGLSEQAGFSIDSLKGRVEIWKRAIYGIQDFPITGMGMNTFREVVHVLYPFMQISPDIDIAHAHNEFLQAALDLGIPGLVAFISIYMITFWMLFRIWKESSTWKMDRINVQKSPGRESSPSINLIQVMVLGLGGGLFAHMLFGMTDAISLGAKPGIFYWMLLGLITSLHHLVCKDTSEN